jgi:hypothetical protein
METRWPFTFTVVSESRAMRRSVTKLRAIPDAGRRHMWCAPKHTRQSRKNRAMPQGCFARTKSSYILCISLSLAGNSADFPTSARMCDAGSCKNLVQRTQNSSNLRWCCFIVHASSSRALAPELLLAAAIGKRSADVAALKNCAPR